MEVAASRYTVDSRDRIVSVDEGWLAFARANDAPELGRERVVGAPLWDFISGHETCELYRIVLGHVRRRDTRVLLPFRCDAPDRRRYMRLVLTPLLGGAVQFDAVVEHEQERPSLPLLDRRTPRSDERLVLCSWCRRVEVEADEWLEAEDAIVRLDLFVAETVPWIVHGVCPDCEQILQRAAQDRPA